MKQTTRTATRRAIGTVLAGAAGAALLTVGAVAQAADAKATTTCSGTASVYGILPDGRLTYSAINPTNGDRIKTLTGADLGFTPQAMATLNFNTILVTSTTGALYRVDVQTNNTALTLANAPVRIADSGWTHDKLTYDGYGHLYGTTSSGLLLQYTVTEDKPAGSQHIGMRKEIDSGFVLKTLTSTGDDRLLGTTSGGALYEYVISSSGTWSRNDLKTDGWSAFDQLLSPGAGVYYGRVPTTGAMYWYKDADPTDKSGADIAYHTSDPVDASGWTQQLLSAAPNSYKCAALDRDDIAAVKAAGREMMNAHDTAWANSTEWSCLENLWDEESGWRWNASNPSGAYGIPQSLPGSKMGTAGADWQTNPLTQIKWGLGYIDDRYGSPCGAWRFFQANNWY
ncbi:aggregation-promoting factor C-terminal-like domain-containing protein [Streptomyces mutabilis]|uniref:Peptidase S1 and S6 n=1 Tax=Streptomyces mutabilis TaxID=67332 RepID=A0A086MQJ1_9ACTN|nr:tachylectin-related carbohydrate-binding protein [Streptomyces mutabilis]KFG71159.1 peptidase S1 and S6 [Streptomyces mutabilis]